MGTPDPADKIRLEMINNRWEHYVSHDFVMIVVTALIRFAELYPANAKWRPTNGAEETKGDPGLSISTETGISNQTHR